MANFNLATRLQAEPVRTLAFGSIVAGYTGVGSPIDHPARQIFIQNLTNQTVMFSFNGVDDHFPLPANGFFLDDISSNRTIMQEFYMAKGDRLYVKQSGVPTSGAVYFTVFYGYEGA